MAEQAEMARDVDDVGGGTAGLGPARARRRVAVVDDGTPRNAAADGARAVAHVNAKDNGRAVARLSNAEVIR